MAATLACWAAGALLMATSLMASATAPITWPVSPPRLHLSTPYGTLQVATSEYVYESHLRIDGDEVSLTVRGILTITCAFRLSTAPGALVSTGKGTTQLPIVSCRVVFQKQEFIGSPECRS